LKNENAQLKEAIMNDSDSGHKIAFLTPWEIRQRKITDMIRPSMKRLVARGDQVFMRHLERFEGEPFADEAMDKLR